jgi:hypothetical protein
VSPSAESAEAANSPFVNPLPVSQALAKNRSPKIAKIILNLSILIPPFWPSFEWRCSLYKSKEGAKLDLRKIF